MSNIEIKKSETIYLTIKGDEEDRYYRKTGHSWEERMGESWETLYDDDLEAKMNAKAEEWERVNSQKPTETIDSHSLLESVRSHLVNQIDLLRGDISCANAVRKEQLNTALAELSSLKVSLDAAVLESRKTQDPHNNPLAMLERSGNISTTDPLATFFYLLSRDVVPWGKIEECARMALDGKEHVFTNGWSAQHCIDLARRLKSMGAAKNNE